MSSSRRSGRRSTIFLASQRRSSTTSAPTSVPGLAAKPFLDLQIRILPLPSHAEIGQRLGPLGFEQARGARPDSPGVARDIPRGDEVVGDDVWEKRLYAARERAVILHVRRSDSPWGRYTVWFRDWLRANPDARAQYELTKRTLSEENVGKPDYDDYTRAKTSFIDAAQPLFTAWHHGLDDASERASR